tara:strand:- start:895 stop:1044 length:150 start_codon:yes stop_codon:yes gene_type:complete
MKKFKKLETGVWTYIDENGHIGVFTKDEFLELNRARLWWSSVKKRYFKL